MAQDQHIAWFWACERREGLVRVHRRSGVWKSSQYKGLCQVTHGFLDILGSNLSTFLEESSANPGAKNQEDFLLVEFGHGVQVRCSSPIGHVLQPGGPTLGSGVVIHCCIGNRFPHSIEITLESMAGVGCASCEERFWGRGNLELKWVRNCWSVMGATRDTDGRLALGRSLILAAM